MTVCVGRRRYRRAQSQAGCTSRTGRARFRRTLDPVWIDEALSNHGQEWREKSSWHDRNRCNRRHDYRHGPRRTAEPVARSATVVPAGLRCAHSLVQSRCSHDRASWSAGMTDNGRRHCARAERHHDAKQDCGDAAKVTTHWATQRCESDRREGRGNCGDNQFLITSTWLTMRFPSLCSGANRTLSPTFTFASSFGSVA